MRISVINNTHQYSFANQSIIKIEVWRQKNCQNMSSLKDMFLQPTALQFQLIEFHTENVDADKTLRFNSSRT